MPEAVEGKRIALDELRAGRVRPDFDHHEVHVWTAIMDQLLNLDAGEQ